MKKVIMSAAALFFGAVVFAQNTSDVKQTGESNIATVNQAGNNTSDIDQEFTSNTATVDQSGINQSTVNQSGNVGGNSASGMNNDADVDQETSQGGQLQTSDIQQQGDGNYAKAMQMGSDNFSNSARNQSKR
ncbi:hypothetical protein ACFSO9_00225 [Mesonia maritima]|uniref:hypothetical protein n=1 Tax=Mesonia maritima TaxID=1793873 RepID=UPI00363A0F12